MSIFTEAEAEYLRAQRLGRLATARGDGRLQNSPVGFGHHTGRDTIDIGGYRMAGTQKWRNVIAGSQVAFVVDDVVSTDPWTVRCLEIRGTAEVITEPGDSAAPVPGPIIRIHPRRIISYGIDPGGRATSRDV